MIYIKLNMIVTQLYITEALKKRAVNRDKYFVSKNNFCLIFYRLLSLKSNYINN